jgi:hypothetical protein
MGDFEISVLGRISDYTRPLQPLVEEFYGIIRDAHEQHKYEGLHAKVIEAFDKAEQRLVQPPSSDGNFKRYRAMEIEEEKRRVEDCEGHWDVHSPIRPTKAEKYPDALPPSHDDYHPEPTSPTPASKRVKVSMLGEGTQTSM